MKKVSNKARFAETACAAFNGYHAPGEKKTFAVEKLLKGEPALDVGATYLESFIAEELAKAYSKNASYEENCERAYRQMNAVANRIRRVRDAFGRTIGKCR